MWRHLSPGIQKNILLTESLYSQQTLNQRMPGHLVQELLQAKSPLLDELRLEDAVVVVEEGKLLGEGLAGEGGHHNLDCPGQFISQPLISKYNIIYL